MKKVETKEDARQLLLFLKKEINTLDVAIKRCVSEGSLESHVEADVLTKIMKTRQEVYDRRLQQFGWMTGYADDYLPKGVTK